MTDRRRAAARALVLATAIAIALVALRRLDTLPNGLRGQYFSNIDWSGEPVQTVIDATVSTATLLASVGGSPANAFSATWSGWIIAPHDDAYTFATTSDDGSFVYIDTQLVVDNGGSHGSTTKTGATIRLTRGPHAVFIKYFQSDGGVELDWLWQRGAGPFDPVPASALRPRRIEYSRFVLDRSLEIAGTVAVWAWAAAAIAAVVFAFQPEIGVARSRAAAAKRQLVAEGAWNALVVVVAASAAIDIVGLWWGLPRGVWVGDELIPTTVVSAWSQHFAHGWSDKYPPLHFYVLTLAYAPVVAAGDIIRLDPVVNETLLMVSGRLVSVVMAAATLVVVFGVGRRAFGVRSGLFAAALTALAAPFVYYAKAANVDVPYLFWFALSLLFYLRAIEVGARRDFIAWGIASACAVCTKDQAYGLYLLMPLPVIVERWRARRPLLAPLATAAAAAAVTFVVIHNLFFNTPGFIAHLRTILGPASQGYRAFEASAAGQAALLDVTLRMIPLSLGWPVTVVCVAGIAVAARSRPLRQRAVWLLVPVLSYYLGFISVVLYNYDRFLMPIFLILSMFGGLALDRFTALPWPRALRATAVAALFGYTLLFSVTVDALMLTDSRYGVEAWLIAQARPDDLVATTSIATYMPRTAALNAVELYDERTLDELAPRFVVVNADYTLTERQDSPLGRLLARLRSGSGGYTLALKRRSPPPWPWLPGGHADLVGSRQSPELVSFLRNVNPTIEVYERTPR